MGVRRYPNETRLSDGRPEPKTRTEDYRVRNLWSYKWASYNPTGPVRVERETDDAPVDTWFFRAERTSDDGMPYNVALAPYKHSYEPLSEGPNGTPKHRSTPPRGRHPETRERRVTLEEVPDAVLDLLRENEHVEVKVYESLDE